MILSFTSNLKAYQYISKLSYKINQSINQSQKTVLKHKALIH